MTDPAEDLLRKNARKLATELLRDPFLAVGYRDMVFNSWHDSNVEDLVDRWMVDAGYATRHDLLSKELTEAPRTNLAAWDGAYLVRVDQKEIVVLEINAHGVRIGGRRVADASFSDGVLAFGPSKTSPWAAELRLTRVAPADNQSLSAGGTYQWLCDGKLWRQDAAKPAKDNAHGATARVIIRPDHHTTPLNAALRTEAALGATAGDGANPTFLGQWAGKYKVTLRSTETKPSKTDPTVSEIIVHYQNGPDYGVTGTSESSVTLTYVTPYSCDVTTIQQPLEPNHIVYDDGVNHFDLTFGTFTDGFRAFWGFIYPKNADPKTIPTTPNAAGDSANPPNPPETWSTPVIVALTASSVVSGIIGAVVTLAGVWLTNYLTAKRELHNAEQSGNQGNIQTAQQKLSDKKIELKTIESKTISSDSQIKILGTVEDQKEFTDLVIKNTDAKLNELTQFHNGFTSVLQRLQQEIPRLEGELLKITETRVKIELKEIAGNIEEWKRKEAEAMQEVSDIHAMHEEAVEALHAVEEQIVLHEKEHELASNFHGTI